MITGKITLHKSTTPAPSQPATRFHFEMGDDDEDGMFCGYPSRRRGRTYDHDTYTPTLDPEKTKEALKVLREMVSKTLPEQGWVIGAKVTRASQTGTVTDIGTIMFLSTDPVNAVKFTQDKVSYQPIFVFWKPIAGVQNSGFGYNYSPEELRILPAQEPNNANAS